MIRAEIEIDEINYENLVMKIIPTRWLHSIAKVGLQLIKSKDTLLLRVFSNYKDILMDKINTYCVAEKIPLHIRDAELNQRGKGTKNILVLTMTLDEINYRKAIETIFPKMLESLSEREDKQGEVIRYLAGMGATPLIMTEAAFDAVSQRTKDEMLTTLMNIYQEDIVKGINHILAKNDITSEISSFRVEVLTL